MKLEKECYTQFIFFAPVLISECLEAITFSIYDFSGKDPYKTKARRSKEEDDMISEAGGQEVI